MKTIIKVRSLVLVVLLFMAICVPVLADSRDIYEQDGCLGIGPDGEGYPEGCNLNPIGGGKGYSNHHR